jgi:hypothetical protein
MSVVDITERLRGEGLDLPSRYVREVVEACQRAGGNASLLTPDAREALTKRVAAELLEDRAVVRRIVDELARAAAADPSVAPGPVDDRGDDDRAVAARVARRLTEAGMPISSGVVVEVMRAQSATLGPPRRAESPDGRWVTADAISGMTGLDHSAVAWILHEVREESAAAADDTLALDAATIAGRLADAGLVVRPEVVREVLDHYIDQFPADVPGAPPVDLAAISRRIASGLRKDEALVRRIMNEADLIWFERDPFEDTSLPLH